MFRFTWMRYLYAILVFSALVFSGCNKDKFSLRVKAVQDKSVSKDIDISADMVFAVKTNPLK
ncbi:MAG: hypothetical protein QNL27_01635 [Bacteroidia bacterium]